MCPSNLGFGGREYGQRLMQADKHIIMPPFFTNWWAMGRHLGLSGLQEDILEEISADNQAEPFSWTKQWYPLAAVKDLEPSRPHAEMLLGEFRSPV